MSERCIYVLELVFGRYYVGESDDPERRFQEHLAGTKNGSRIPGAAWTSKYKSMRIASTTKSSGPTAEDAMVKAMMLEHGIDMVRGGSYSNVILSKMQIDALRAELWGAHGKCLRCGRAGHWIKDCYATKDVMGSIIGGDTSAAPTETHITASKPSESHSSSEQKRSTKDARERSRSSEPEPNIWGIIGSAIAGAITKIGEGIANAEQRGLDSANTCLRCGRAGHQVDRCYASRHVNGSKLE